LRPEGKGGAVEAMRHGSEKKTAGVGARMADWSLGLGAVIEDMDSADLPMRLVETLARLVPFELVAMVVFQGRSRPVHIFDNFELMDANDAVIAYVENTYVLNPFYQACQNRLPDGVYRIRDLAPDAFFDIERYRRYRAKPSRSEEIGYITEGWPEQLEEVDIAITLKPNVVGELSIYRPLCERGFTDDELDRLSAVVPVLRAMLKRYWLHFGESKLQASPPDGRVDRLFAEFGSSVLSDRERDVVQLILRGHSSESIGLNLGISLGTVKTHRRNAYAKLGISSQSELLSQFLETLHSD